MGVPGKTRGHSIDIVLGGSRNNRGTMAGFTKELVDEAKDPTSDMNEPFKKAVLNSTAVNRAGSPVRMMNNNIMNTTDMGQMPFQNDAIVNAQGMKGTDIINPVVNPNIPGTLPGSGNVPGNQQIPNPVARLKKSNPPQPTQKPETEEFKRAWQKYQEELKTDPVLQKSDQLFKINEAMRNDPREEIYFELPQERGISTFEEDEEFVD